MAKEKKNPNPNYSLTTVQTTLVHLLVTISAIGAVHAPVLSEHCSLGADPDPSAQRTSASPQAEGKPRPASTATLTLDDSEVGQCYCH